MMYPQSPNVDQRPTIQPMPVQQLTTYYQMSTKNKSFMEMHYFLKQRGIKQNRFFLALFDTDLAGVDPHDPNLSFIMKQKIIKEVSRNFWYFLREVVRVFESGNPAGVPFRLNRGNLAFYFCSLYNLNGFLELPRQVGKTTAAEVRYLYIYNFGTANSSIVLMHKDQSGAKSNLNDIKKLRDLLPPYLRMDQQWNMVNGKKKKLPATVTQITNPTTHNEISITSSARNAMLAGNLLRGKTITLLWPDEWAFIRFNNVIYNNGMPALNTAFQAAERNGAPYGILITTTAGILSSDEGVFAYKQIQDATPFDESWYNMTRAEILDIVNSNMKSIFVYIKFSYIELGMGEKWFADICRKINDPVTIRREILLEWIDQPDNSPFSADDLEALRGMVREPMKTLMLMNKFKFSIFSLNGTMTRANPLGLGIPLNMRDVPINPPIIGVDPSGGLNRDYSCITIIDSVTTEVIATMKCNYISPPDLVRAIYLIVTTMMPNAIVNIERNGGFGAALIGKLKETSIAHNLYFEYKDRVIEETNDDFGRVVRKKVKTKIYGTDETPNTRENLMELLRERMEMHKDKIKSKELFDELSKMVVKRSGKVEHSENSHDDLVFSYLMALYVWYEGKNLKENWHVNKTTIRTESNVDDIVGIPEEEKEYVSTVESIENDELNPSKQEVKKLLEEMKRGMGITLAEFKAQEQAKEDAYFKDMMQNAVVRKAYAEANQMPEEDIDAICDSVPGMYHVPDSLFINANSGLSPEEIAKREYDKNFTLEKVKIEN